MDTVIVASSQFYSHYPKRIPQGTVNAEAVLIRLDSEWDNLTVRIHWLNVASGVEKVVLLERDQPNTIPWEVLADLSELRMGLDGMDGGTIVKPTVWLTYGYVVDGVDPESGSDPQPPTPSWEQQMVEQARVAAEAAEEAKDAAVNAGKAASQSGPYADEAKKSAEAAKKAQDAAATSAQEARNAKDQANIASNTAKGHADAAGTAKVEAERAAEMAGNAQSGAAQSAQNAARSASEAQKSKEAAEAAATAFPPLTEAVANKILAADESGKKLVFIDPPGGGGSVGEFEDVAELITKAQAKIVNLDLPFPLDACRVSVTIPPESSSTARNLYIGQTMNVTSALCRSQSYGSSTTLETVYEFLVLKKHGRWLAMSLARGGTPTYQQVPIYTISNGLCLSDATTPIESLTVFTYSADLPKGTIIFVEGVRNGS